MFVLYTTSLCGRKGQSERQLLRHQAAVKSSQRLQASPAVQLRLSARWRTCSHSSSCPRLDQEEMPWFHWKNEWPPNSPDPSPLDYHVWCAILGRYQKYTPKPTNIAELKTALLSIWNDLPQEFVDKIILSF